MSERFSDQRHTQAAFSFAAPISWGVIERLSTLRLSAACEAHDGHRNLDHSLLADVESGRAWGWLSPDQRAYVQVGVSNQVGRAELLVHPQLRGQGLGQQLLDHAVKQLRTVGATCIDIWAYGDPVGVVGWLERNGFRSRRRLLYLERHATPVPKPGLPSGWVIRSFQDGDQTKWHFLHSSLQADPRLAWTRRRLDQQLLSEDTPASQFWLLWEQQQLRGYLWLKGNELFMFALAPECRGQGMGQRLLDWGLAQGDGSARVFCDDHREGAMRLFARNGFVERGKDRCLRLTF